MDLRVHAGAGYRELHFLVSGVLAYAVLGLIIHVFNVYSVLLSILISLYLNYSMSGLAFVIGTLVPYTRHSCNIGSTGNSPNYNPAHLLSLPGTPRDCSLSVLNSSLSTCFCGQSVDHWAIPI
ncbi:hypothetical protein [Metallosphaera hakonensis]|uniref:hypothetical protein n=1 Tax=Metallosphaera hakonensis TaxID=79601 RepID=UPI002092DE2E|nr:hypothetical protein [Metallosphaera hakonensis]